MTVESVAAVRQLLRELSSHGIKASGGSDQVVIQIGIESECWCAVYRYDGKGFRCWDFFPNAKDPGPGKYSKQIADRLLSTTEVVGHVRRMRG